MIGPGTGIAPFIGLIEERLASPEKQFPYTTLYFGCKSATSDFIYKDLLNKAKDENIINDLNIAFS